MSTVRLALVGIGGYGWGLGEWIGRMSAQLDCRLVAAADAQLDAFADKAQRLRAAGVELFGDAAEMFQKLRGQLDGVYIATSIHSHMPLALKAFEAGLHVHLEKPAAATVQEVDCMADAARSAGRLCLVGFQAIHSTDIQRIKQAVVDGEVGPISRITCHAGWPRAAKYYNRNNWAGKLRSGERWVLDGPAMNALAHQVANMLLVASRAAGQFAQPTAVRAELYAAGPVESHDTAAIEIRTDAGVTCLLYVSHCTMKAWHPTMELTGQRGVIRWQMNVGGEILPAGGKPKTFAFDDQQHGRMIRNFVEAVRSGDGSMLRCDLPAARTHVLALDGAHESSGRIHRIDSEFTQRLDGGTDEARTVVDDLDAMLPAAAEAGCLFSELPNAPKWTARTRPFDVRGYKSFPQRFVP